MLNISNSDIKKSDIITDGDTIYYDITLVRKPMTCPYCGGKMIGHGHKLRLIKHPAIRNYSGIIRYNANRYICKEFNKTAIAFFFSRLQFIFSPYAKRYETPCQSQLHSLHDL